MIEVAANKSTRPPIRQAPGREKGRPPKGLVRACAQGSGPWEKIARTVTEVERCHVVDFLRHDGIMTHFL